MGRKTDPTVPARSRCKYCEQEIEDRKLAAHLRQFHAEELRKERERG